MPFAWVHRYTGSLLGVDLTALRPGMPQVVESPRRMRAEQSYGFVHALWFVRLADGPNALSVPPGAGAAVKAILDHLPVEPLAADPPLLAALRPPVDRALAGAGLRPVDRAFRDLVFASDGQHVRLHAVPGCRRITDDAVPAADGLRLPLHCFPDGVVFGVVRGQRVVSVAYAHRAGVLEDVIADVGVETAPAHRRRGYARAAVSALVAHFTERGGESRYACKPDNAASIATARSVGFVPYGESLILSSPGPSDSP